MARPNMREFRERADWKQLRDRLYNAMLSFRKHVHTQDKQTIDKYAAVMPKPNIEDMGVFPALGTRVVDSYKAFDNSKRDALFGMLQMSVIMWWWHQEKQLSKENIESLCTTLESIGANYPEEKLTRVPHGYTFIDFFVLMNSTHKND